MADNAGMFAESRRPPARLAKLQKRKKKERILTEEQIQAKLRKAEERKKVRSSLLLSYDALFVYNYF